MASAPASPELDRLRATLAGERAWLVGGAVRDRLLGRPTDDYDVVLEGDVERAAKAYRRGAFPLSEAFGGWRAGKVDFLPLVGGTLESDLAARDFTVNAMAEPLHGGALVDLFGGLADLEARRLRPVSDSSFAADPLRVLRLVRLAAELGFSAETALAFEAAPGLARVAAERVFAELKRIVVCGSDAVRLMDRVGALAVVVPELQALKGVEQSVYHDADVYEHTLAVLDEVAALDGPAELHDVLANELTRWEAMRFAALLHDIAKPGTAGVRADGRGTSFVGHDAAGAEIARGILLRLKASNRLADYVAALTRHHLRVGFLVHRAPLARRDIHRYLVATAPWAVDVTVFTCADRLATRGRNAGPATEAHLALARELLDAAAAGLPEPLVRGNELGLPPGPEIAAILARLAEDQYAGELTTREEALARAREYSRTHPDSE